MLGAGASPAKSLFNATSVASSFHRSSITRIKDQNLFLRDINQERAQMEASREQISPKGKLARPPSFSDSPKEDKENEKGQRDGFSKEDSGTESGSEDSSEEDSEEDSEEEQPPKPSVNSVGPRSNVTVNSVSSKPAVNSLKKPEDESDSEEETGSETEESSEEEEEEEEPVRPDTRTSTTSSSRTPVTTHAQSTPFSTSKPGVGGPSKLLKSPFLDNDKKANAPSSPVSETEPSRTSRLAGKEETKDDTKSRFGSYPTRTTADTTSNATSTTTTSSRDRISTTPSEDTQSRTTRAKRVTKRAATSYVGGGVGGGKGDGDEDEEDKEDGKSNDISHRKTIGDDERKVMLE